MKIFRYAKRVEEFLQRQEEEIKNAFHLSQMD